MNYINLKLTFLLSIFKLIFSIFEYLNIEFIHSMVQYIQFLIFLYLYSIYSIFILQSAVIMYIPCIYIILYLNLRFF